MGCMVLHMLKDWREKFGISQEALGAELGTTGASISRIEAGLQQPSLELAVALERRTGIPAREFVKKPAREDAA